MKICPYIVIVILSIILVMSWCSRPTGKYDTTTSDTVWIHHIDTVRDTIIPPPVFVHTVRQDTVFLPVVKNEPADTDLTQLPDSIPVSLPITEKEYQTEDYKILISGYNPSLDYVELYHPTRLGIIKQKNKRWGLGLSAGYGIGPRGFTPVLAVTFNYNMFQW
jgi:hypothetical protein